jgi:hypothetical protein
MFSFVRTLFVIGTLLVSFASARAQRPLSPDGPDERQAGRQTVGGALYRADRALEPWNRGALLERQNFGRQGRVNATSDAARESEEPRAVRSGFSPWTRF